MSSILTNNGAMVALQTLKTINSDLTKTQSMISTGKNVNSAKDNASVWAISKVMEADVRGFKGISDSLSLGESSVSVARQATETVTDLLVEIKGKVVAAQEANVDRDKIQTDISALRDQITSVVGSAQFNGLNLLQGTEDMNVLSSLDRASDGTVATSHITVNRQDLSTGAGVYGGGGVSLSANASISDSATAITSSPNFADFTLTYDAAGSYDFTIGGNSISVAGTTDLTTTTDAVVSAINALGLDGISASNQSDVVRINSTKAFESVAVTAAATGGSAAVDVASATIAQRAETITFSGGQVNDGDSYRVSLGGTNYNYVAGKGETFEDVARGLKTAVDGGNITDVTTRVAKDTNGAWTLQIDNNTGADITLAVTGEDGGTASGGLFGLDNIDVSSSAGAQSALGNIETMINNSIDAAASFGSVQGRIQTQSDFIGKLSNALKSGIGSLVDANMEETSARLQALQVQQQLGVQSLSIANQAPQSILSLFR